MSSIEQNSAKSKGLSLIGVLILGFFALLVLSYFKVNVKDVVQSPTGQDNIHYVGDTTTSFWDRYLRQPASYLWNDVWLPIFWRPFIENMKDIRDGKPTDYQTYSPKTNFQ